MTRHAARFVAVGVLLISGCATAPAHTSTPVAVTVTSDTASKSSLNQFRDTIREVLAKQVPNAHPTTINVKLDVTSSAFQEPPNVVYSEPARAEQGHTPAEFSFRNPSSEQITSCRVAYTISDAAGQVVESNQLTLDGEHLVGAKAGAPLKARSGLAGDMAMFLAARVKTLDQ